MKNKDIDLVIDTLEELDIENDGDTEKLLGILNATKSLFERLNAKYGNDKMIPFMVDDIDTKISIVQTIRDNLNNNKNP